MAFIFANNASSALAVTISAVDVSIQLSDTSDFPIPTGGDVFYVTLEDNAGNIEIVRCSGNDGVNLLTVDTISGRGIDGTTAQAFTATVTRVEQRLVKTILDNWLQLTGGILTGNLDMNGNDIIDPTITGAGGSINGLSEIVGSPIRGLTGVSSNEIAVPSGGGRATVGGVAILATGDDIESELDVAGVITFNSATIGIHIPGVYLRWSDSDDSHRYQIAHNGTDITSSFTLGGATQKVRFIHPCDFEGDTDYGANEILNAEVRDMSVSVQTIAAATGIEAIDYTAGHYVDMTLTGNVTALSVTNPSNSGTLAQLRLKITQGGTGSYTIDWSGIYFAQGNAVNPAPPILQTAVGAIDYVDLWSSNGGTTWFGAWDGKWVVTP